MNNEQLFKDMIKTGFEPLKDFVEYKKLETLTENDVDLVMSNIGENIKSWIKWLNHKKNH